MIRARLRRPSALLLLAALAVLPACGGTTASKAPAGAPTLTVMTRNLYLGADLTPLISGGSPLAVIAAVTASKPAERMTEVAAEIAAAKPDLVALQEVSRWEIGSTVYDFQAELLDALQQAGAPYHVVVAQDNFDSAKLNVALPARFLDRDVLIARGATAASGPEVLGTAERHFSSQLTYAKTPFGVPVTFTRGYVWADVRDGSRTLRVVDTHTEAYLDPAGADYTAPQLDELAAALKASPYPVVVLGDLNSGPADTKRLGYAHLRQAGYTDLWARTLPGQQGFSCCRDAALAGGTLTERIDQVMLRGAVHPVGTPHLVGVDPASAAAPRWASDHAGVVAGVAAG